MARQSHSEMQELVGAYALDALEPDEVDAFERHLSECPRCRAELNDHRETAAMLAHAGTEAPDGLWDRIVANLEEAPPDMATVFRMPTGDAREARVAKTRGPRWRTVGVAAAGLAAAIIAVNTALLVRQDDKIGRFENNQTISHLADLAMADPSSRVVSLRSADGAVSADAVLRPNGTSYLLHTRLPKLDNGQTSQLWGLAEGRSPVSLSVLGSNPKVAGFTAKLSMNQLAITVERAGGATVPSQLPLISGAVT
jgi:anti-sigma-K factor RskA